MKNIIVKLRLFYIVLSFIRSDFCIDKKKKFVLYGLKALFASCIISYICNYFFVENQVNISYSSSNKELIDLLEKNILSEKNSLSKENPFIIHLKSEGDKLNFLYKKHIIGAFKTHSKFLHSINLLLTIEKLFPTRAVHIEEPERNLSNETRIFFKDCNYYLIQEKFLWIYWRPITVYLNNEKFNIALVEEKKNELLHGYHFIKLNPNRNKNNFNIIKKKNINLERKHMIIGRALSYLFYDPLELAIDHFCSYGYLYGAFNRNWNKNNISINSYMFNWFSIAPKILFSGNI
jgi:hypothetical protein